MKRGFRLPGLLLGVAGGGTPTPTPTAKLYFSGSEMPTSFVAGTKVGRIFDVPSGVTPVWTGDARLAVSGSEATGWYLVVGSTPASQGSTITGNITATGCVPRAVSVAVRAPASMPAFFSGKVCMDVSAEDVAPQADNTSITGFTSASGLPFVTKSGVNNPKYRTNRSPNGKPTIQCNRVTATHIEGLQCLAANTTAATDSTTGLATNASMIMWVGRNIGQGGDSTNPESFGVPFGFEYDTGTNPGGLWAMVVGSWTRGFGGVPGTKLNLGNGFYVAIRSRDNITNITTESPRMGRISIAGTNVGTSGTVSATTGSGNMVLGANGGRGSPHEMHRVMGFGALSRAVQLADIQGLLLWMHDYYSEPYPWIEQPYFLGIEGDSIVQGTQSGSGNAAIFDTMLNLGIPVGCWTNEGVPSSNMVNMTWRLPNIWNQVTTLTKQPLLLFAWEYANRAGRNNQTSVDNYVSQDTAFMDALRTAVPTVTVAWGTSIAGYFEYDPTFAADYISTRALYNTTAMGYTSAPNIVTVADIHTIPNLGVAGSSPNSFPGTPNTYFADGLHPNSAGQALFVPKYQAAYAAMIANWKAAA